MELSQAAASKLSAAGAPLFPLPVLATVCLAAFTVYLLWHQRKYGNNRGPPIWPVIGSFPAISNAYPLLHHWILGNVKRHNGTFRIAVPGVVDIITCEPANVEYILKTNFANYPKGEFFQRHMRQLLGHGIFNSDDDTWRQQRKTASHEFSQKSLRELIVSATQRLIQGRLLPVLSRAAASSGSEVDLQTVFQHFNFDNICAVGFGVESGCLQVGLPPAPVAASFDSATSSTFIRFWGPPILWQVKKALRIGTERELFDSMAVVDKFAADIISARRVALEERARGPAAGGSGAQGAKDLGAHDLLSRFMALQGEDGSGPSDAFLRDVVTNFILAGRDSLTAGMSWFFWVLMEHNHVLEKIREETNGILAARHESGGPPSGTSANTATGNVTPPLREELPAGRDVSQEAAASAPPHSTHQGEANGDETGGAEAGARPGMDGPGVVFSFEELKQMHYLHAAVTECMRLHPPVPSDSKHAVRDDVLPDGMPVSAGDRVSYYIWCMGRLEELWGADCLEFRPERWLRGGEFVPESPYKYPVFNAGPRTCLGKDMAYIVIKSVAASVLQQFDFRARQGFAPRYKAGITLMMEGGLPVHVLDRDESQHVQR